MPTKFTATIGLRGTNGKVSNLNYDLGTFTEADAGADFIAAQSALTQIVGALEDVTDAAVAFSALHSVQSQSGTVPAAADVFEKASVVCYLNDPSTEAEKTTNINIPAPVIGIFQGASGSDRDKIDKADADLVQFIQQISQHAFVSDGEQIDTTVTDGIKGGRRVVTRVKLGLGL